MLEGLVASAVVLFFIFDPFASLPIFIGLTKDQDKAQMIKSANRACFVAALLFVIFAIFGQQILDLFSISISSFKVAGGLVLMMMAVEVIFGIELSKHKNEEVAWVVIATPILTGPGVIATAILLVDQYDVITVLLAGGFALLVTWLALAQLRLHRQEAGQEHHRDRLPHHRSVDRRLGRGIHPQRLDAIHRAEHDGAHPAAARLGHPSS